jgi:soluble lytic murein transglycosylase-like protein
MKNKIHSTANKFMKYSRNIMPSAFILAMLHFPFMQAPTIQQIFQNKSVRATAEIITGATNIALAEVVFGTDTAKDVVQGIIDKQMSFVSSRKAYGASLAVIEKHVNTIKEIARAKGVPEDVAIGVSLLENGGSETAKSPAGALGVFQLMPGTARSLGLTVNKKTDDRMNPTLNISAGITYLKNNYDRFGDWGLATWAYHAGEGNVAKALQIYAKANSGVSLGGVKNAEETRAYVAANGITVHKLLSDPRVKAMTDKLNDDTAGYPYKVVATATLFKQTVS